MQTTPRFEFISEKKLIGKHLKMSLADNKTFQLWQSFMPRRKEILNKINSELISLQIYDEPMRFGDFQQEFVKWAAVEVTGFENIPEEVGAFTLESGLYAVFDYKGLNTDPGIFIHIFGSWLPNSDFVLDNRPHFEILGEKYKNNDPNSEEEIWIPIKPN
ncbi:MAG: GyrI-like domain-containing protein [Pyrinomonadaceae bacterium]|nr:GyrI-like domain-containing protein [Pyrinomonadaceae bacterium]